MPGRLVVAGDSAGGNLALGLMLALRDAGEALPDAAVLFSPAIDLTGGSPSMQANAERDAMFRGPHLVNLAQPTWLMPTRRSRSPRRCSAACAACRRCWCTSATTRCCATTRCAWRQGARGRRGGGPAGLRRVPHVWQLLWLLARGAAFGDGGGRFLKTRSRDPARSSWTC